MDMYVYCCFTDCYCFGIPCCLQICPPRCGSKKLFGLVYTDYNDYNYVFVSLTNNLALRLLDMYTRKGLKPT